LFTVDTGVVAEEGKTSSTEVVRLRALAHPLRWKLIDVLEAEGTVTATRCAQVTGESVASCSYHLSVLAKYGYIHPAPSESRERPWQLTNREQVLSTPEADAEVAAATREAIDAFLEHQFEQIRRSRRTIDLEPKQWRKAGMAGAATMWVTTEELLAMKKDLAALLHRYDDRQDPGARPEGVRLTRLFVASTVVPEAPSNR
jgi:hypothetical protein